MARLVTVLIGLALLDSPGAGAAVVPETADLRLAGSVEEGPDGGGIDTQSTMQYRVTVRNDGPDVIPASGLLLVLFVDRTDSADLATIEVARFNDGGGLQPAAGGNCGNGRWLRIQCTNRQAIEAGQEITLVIGHRHPAPVAGTLSFVAEVSGAQPTPTDPVPGNNSFRGPNYQFRDQPPTTTSTTTSTTMPDQSSTSASSSTTDPDASSTTMESTTSSSTTSSTTSTTAPTTTTVTTATTVSSTTGSSLAALSGSATLPVGQTTLLAGSDTSTDQLVLGQSGDGPSDGGPPYLLLAALAALVLLIGGVATALYAQYNKPPPLVDMRRFD